MLNAIARWLANDLSKSHAQKPYTFTIHSVWDSETLLISLFYDIDSACLKSVL